MGDQESIQALATQRDRLGVSRGKALSEYNAAHAAVTSFDERARLWVDYSNLRELTPDEKTTFDQVRILKKSYAMITTKYSLL